MITYTIRGGDGREYFAEEATAIEWARQGRIERATQVYDGLAWKRAEEIPAIAAAFPPPVITMTVAQTDQLNRTSWGLDVWVF